MKKHFDKFCEWQISHCERMRKLLNLSHCQHLWISFAKGILVGILLCMLTGCSANPKVANKEAPTIQNLDAIGKVLGCVFAPASEECQQLRKEQDVAPDDYCTDDGCPEFKELSK